MRSAITTGIGRKRKDPEPMKKSVGSLKVTMKPEVTSCAMPPPRP